MTSIRQILESVGYRVLSLTKIQDGYYVRSTTGSFKLTKSYQPDGLSEEDTKRILAVLPR